MMAKNPGTLFGQKASRLLLTLTLCLTTSLSISRAEAKARTLETEGCRIECAYTNQLHASIFAHYSNSSDPSKLFVNQRYVEILAINGESLMNSAPSLVGTLTSGQTGAFQSTVVNLEDYLSRRADQLRRLNPCTLPGSEITFRDAEDNLYTLEVNTQPTDGDTSRLLKTAKENEDKPTITPLDCWKTQ